MAAVKLAMWDYATMAITPNAWRSPKLFTLDRYAQIVEYFSKDWILDLPKLQRLLRAPLEIQLEFVDVLVLNGLPEFVQLFIRKKSRGVKAPDCNFDTKHVLRSYKLKVVIKEGNVTYSCLFVLLLHFGFYFYFCIHLNLFIPTFIFMFQFQFCV